MPDLLQFTGPVCAPGEPSGIFPFPALAAGTPLLEDTATEGSAFSKELGEWQASLPENGEQDHRPEREAEATPQAAAWMITVFHQSLPVPAKENKAVEICFGEAAPSATEARGVEPAAAVPAGEELPAEGAGEGLHALDKEAPQRQTELQTEPRRQPQTEPVPVQPVPARENRSVENRFWQKPTSNRADTIERDRPESGMRRTEALPAASEPEAAELNPAVPAVPLPEEAAEAEEAPRQQSVRVEAGWTAMKTPASLIVDAADRASEKLPAPAEAIAPAAIPEQEAVEARAVEPGPPVGKPEVKPAPVAFSGSLVQKPLQSSGQGEPAEKPASTAEAGRVPPVRENRKDRAETPEPSADTLPRHSGEQPAAEPREPHAFVPLRPGGAHDTQPAPPPMTHHAAAASRPQARWMEAAAIADPLPEAQPAQPLRSVTVRISGGDANGTVLHLSNRSEGQFDLAVRTHDTSLAQELRTRLPELERSLDRIGVTAEWTPVTRSSEAQLSSSDSQHGRESGSGQGENGERQHRRGGRDRGEEQEPAPWEQEFTSFGRLK